MKVCQEYEYSFEDFDGEWPESLSDSGIFPYPLDSLRLVVGCDGKAKVVAAGNRSEAVEIKIDRVDSVEMSTSEGLIRYFPRQFTLEIEAVEGTPLDSIWARRLVERWPAVTRPKYQRIIDILRQKH
jgi:hypothetical protein